MFLALVKAQEALLLMPAVVQLPILIYGAQGPQLNQSAAALPEHILLPLLMRTDVLLPAHILLPSLLLLYRLPAAEQM
jgi:hypothetical protein